MLLLVDRQHNDYNYNFCKAYDYNKLNNNRSNKLKYWYCFSKIFFFTFPKKKNCYFPKKKSGFMFRIGQGYSLGVFFIHGHVYKGFQDSLYLFKLELKTILKTRLDEEGPHFPVACFHLHGLKLVHKWNIIPISASMNGICCKKIFLKAPGITPEYCFKDIFYITVTPTK